MMRLVLSIALAAVLASAAQAQDAPKDPLQGLPADVAAEVKRAQGQCEGKVTFGKGFIARPDVNGDKEPDYVVRFEHATCDEMPSAFCGTGGCVIQVFASIGEGKYMLAMDRPAFRVKFARKRGLPAMIQHVHGGDCGRSGGEGPCEAVTYWNGEDFTPAYPLR